MTTNMIPDSIKETQEILWQQMRNSRLSFRSLSCGNNSLLLAYLPYLIDMVTLQQVLLPFLERLPDEKIAPDTLLETSLLPKFARRLITDKSAIIS
ncbi:hypothetical protein [Brevibacillus formosus]|uniref:hypothetical protein n=1 Tax=Brevibacillus formosus TaxID=54913 RepID=UPI001F3FEB89|nr:hypothetical protein [Brevibacillus formosus]